MVLYTLNCNNYHQTSLTKQRQPFPKSDLIEKKSKKKGAAKTASLFESNLVFDKIPDHSCFLGHNRWCIC
jgi:hypothetical protein